MGAAAINAVFIPSPCVHERLHHQAEGHASRALHRFQKVAELRVVAAAASEVFQRVVDFVLEKALEFREIKKVADVPDVPALANQVADRSAIRVAARQGCEVLKANLSGALLHDVREDVRGVEAGVVRPFDRKVEGSSRALRCWRGSQFLRQALRFEMKGSGRAFYFASPTTKDWLEGDAVDDVSVEAKAHRFPEMADVVRCNRHRERDRQIGSAAVLDGPLPHFSEVGPTEFLLASGLDAIELEVELKPKAVEGSIELLGELGVFGKEHAVRVDEHEVDLRVLLEPAAELK